MGKQKRDEFKEQIKRIEKIDQEYPHSELNDKEREVIRTLVNDLQHANAWEPVPEPTEEELAKARAQRAGSNDITLRVDLLFKNIDKKYPLNTPKTNVRFWALHAYLKEVIASWRDQAIPCSAFCASAIAAAIMTIASAMEAFSGTGIAVGILACSALALFGVVASIAAAVALGINLPKNTPNAIPAIKARRHLHRFFKNHPVTVKNYDPMGSVLREIAHPAINLPET